MMARMQVSHQYIYIYLQFVISCFLAEVRVYEMLLWMLRRRRKEIKIILEKIESVKQKLQPADAPYYRMILDYGLCKLHNLL